MAERWGSRKREALSSAHRRWVAGTLVVGMAVLGLPAYRAELPAQTIGRHGIVSTSHPLASTAGLRVLQQGGNAVDAAVASAAVLAVANPFMAGLGGVGGYALVYDAASGRTETLDFIGTAPQAARRELYLGDKLWDFGRRATDGYLAPVVPGILAGWAALHERYGRLPWAQVLAPAIEYARDGFPLTSSVARSMTTGEMSKVRRYPYGRSIFSNGNDAWQAGEMWVQQDFATTLEAIARGGAKEFYKGSIAKKIAEDMARNGGLITLEDLANYEAVWRTPISTTYRGYDVLTQRPGSSGITILQWLNVLEGYDLERLGRNSPEYIHLVAEVEKLGFLDDDRYNTGRLSAKIPLERLISKEYAAQQRERIDLERAQFFEPLSPASISTLGEHTSHHTVVDKDHNIVTITQTLMYASGVVVPETGVILNNGMSYFSLEDDGNRIEGGERPRFVMSPVIVFRGGKPFLAVGAAGGWTIPQTILQTILNVVDFRMDVGRAAGGPRFILRFLRNSIPYVPGTDLELDGGISAEVRQKLESKGHRLVAATPPDDSGATRALNAVVIDPKSGALWGAGGAVAW
jgi:gamma-glutamyltranspeptidase / glutathione hydrolase